MGQEVSSNSNCRWKNFDARITEIDVNIKKLTTFSHASLHETALRIDKKLNKTRALVVNKCVSFLPVRILRLYDRLRATQSKNLVTKYERIMQIFQDLTKEIDSFSHMESTCGTKISIATAKSVLGLVKNAFDARIESATSF